MTESIKHTAIKYLERANTYVFGGTIERDVSEIHSCKTSNVGRRLRELEATGAIEARYVENPNGKNKVVQYRLKPPAVVIRVPIIRQRGQLSLSF